MSGLLTVKRLQATCEFAGAPEIAVALADRASGALRRHLAGTLRRSLASWCDREDASVWIVRRVDLSVPVTVDVPADLLAAAVGASLSAALGAALVEHGDGVNTIRFPSRAAYLGQFVADAASGDAWSRWYYGPFAGLKALSASAAIRTALVSDPPCGLAALGTLADGTLAGVAAALTPEDEATVLSALAETGRTGSRTTAETFHSAWVGCARAWRLGSERGSSLIALVRADCTASLALADAILMVLDARRAARAASRAELAQLHAAIERSVDGEAVQWGASSLRATPRTIARALLAEVADPTQPPGHAAIATRFGGMVMLLRDLDDLPWDEWTAGWPVPLVGTASGILKWLTVAVCAGGEHARAALSDAALRTVFGIPSAATFDDIGQWLRQVGPGRRLVLASKVAAIGRRPAALAPRKDAWLEFPRSSGVSRPWSQVLTRIARAVLHGFAQRLPGFAGSAPDYLWRNFLAGDATLELDQERIVVRCGRVPLHVVLTLTGMTRGLEAGRDAQGRPILVFPRE
jgi:hypothetical protein